MAFFDEMGCVASDHGIVEPISYIVEPNSYKVEKFKAAEIYQKCQVV